MDVIAEGINGAVGPPPLRDLFRETPRAAGRLFVLPWMTPVLASAPRGDGHPVLVLPGLLASDASTGVLRGFLRYLGYDTHGWRLGRNLGPTAQVLDGMRKALDRLAERAANGQVSIIGWSLGGIYARELARQNAHQVRQVITLGSPFAMTDSRQSRADATYRRRAHLHAANQPTRAQVAQPIPVPSTAIYSRSDGVVGWQTCIEPASPLHENVEVNCGHLGFGVDTATLWVVADRLAQPVLGRREFRAPHRLQRLYPGAQQ